MRYLLGFACILMLIFYACGQNPFAVSAGASLSGENAMEYVRTQVSFGPRPPGSAQLQKCREFIVNELRGFGYRVEDDAFTAETPYGPIEMHNLIARKGDGDRGAIVLASHYDTKLMEGMNFVGANDAGSSTGLLLELARVLASKEDLLDYWFLFTDGEEAFMEWSTFDSTYGSRHLAKRWKREGIAEKIHALILLDMIGDKDLDIFYDTNSTPWLMDLVWETASRMGLES
ncbi:MAG: M28 family peptidase, partial [Acidobacteria bacterium]|nr:M28 family peptidase [Acidobacteriota bacterium]